ncbi:hypothetical protein ACSLNK_28900, partial [Escherichia coli]
SKVRLSISQIEDLVTNAGDSHTLQQPIPLDYALVKYCKGIDREKKDLCFYESICCAFITST